MALNESARPYLNLGVSLSLGVFLVPLTSIASYLLVGLGVSLFIITGAGILILEGLHHSP